MPYHHGNLRDTLIEASLELIRTDGLDALTLREAARRAGVSHTAPYRHFRDKEGLLAAVVERGFERLAAHLRSSYAAETAPLLRLYRAGVAYVTFGIDHPMEYRLMFQNPLDPARHPAAADAFGILVELAAALAAPRLQPRNAAHIAWAQVHGITELALLRQLPYSSRADLLNFAAMATGALLAGLTSSSLPPTPSEG